MRNDVFEQVKFDIKEQELFCAGDRVIVGVSGGADSVFLLEVLVKLRDEGLIDVYAVHVHHGIRGSEADGDAEFVRRICEERSVPCLVEYVDVPAMAKAERLTPEEAGRKARYECFRREKARVGATKLAVAHHMDDSAETVLFNLMRGSGIKGLSGIAPVQGDIVRPLLGLRRNEIEQALSEKNIRWRTDSTNEELIYTRNRIRRELIPYLERELNPEAVDHLAMAAKSLREIDEHMERTVDEWLPGETDGRLNVERLKNASVALQGYLIRRRLSECGGLKDIGREHIEAVRELIGKPVGKTVCLPGGRTVQRDYEELEFFAGDVSDNTENWDYEVTWSEISEEIFKKIQFDQYTKCFDYDMIKGNLHLRGRKTGDRIAVFADGRTQSVKEYMINARIPAKVRDDIPLLVGGDEVLWIVGYRASEAFRVTDETRRILLVTAKKLTGEQAAESCMKK